METNNDAPRGPMRWGEIHQQLRLFYLLLSLVAVGVFLGYLWGHTENAAQGHQWHVYLPQQRRNGVQAIPVDDGDSEAVQEATE